LVDLFHRSAGQEPDHDRRGEGVPRAHRVAHLGGRAGLVGPLPASETVRRQETGSDPLGARGYSRGTDPRTRPATTAARLTSRPLVITSK
jgi:hypothetical protein